MLRSLKLVMFAVTKDFMFSRVIPYLFLLALCLPVLSSGQLPKQNAGEDPFSFFTDTAGLPEGILQKQLHLRHVYHKIHAPGRDTAF